MIAVADLPHRFPFLILDRIQTLIPGEQGQFCFHSSTDGYYLSESAPPSFRQALLLEAMAEGAGLILISGSGRKDEPAQGKGYLLRLDRVFFEALPRAGREIRILVNKKMVFGHMVQFQAQAKSGEAVVARAELTLWHESMERGQEDR